MLTTESAAEQARQVTGGTGIEGGGIMLVLSWKPCCSKQPSMK